MESLNDVGIPLADALAERLGCHVVILAVGPVGSEKGEVCLRTYAVYFILHGTLSDHVAWSACSLTPAAKKHRGHGPSSTTRDSRRWRLLSRVMDAPPSVSHL
jgi:hypothetical protein